MDIASLQPQPVWQQFAQLCQIPRPSHHEQAVLAHIERLAQRCGLPYERDDTGNLLVRKPAQAIEAELPTLILQAHVDMVPQKEPNCGHNFVTDPIQAYVNGDWVTAQGTTLGADNGLGLAAILAVLVSTDVCHGPLEALFTINEEDGMSGALGLRRDWLQGQWLLNLDSEDEGFVYVGCAGAQELDIHASWPTEMATGQLLELHVSGLRGGHSGLDIDKGRANSLLLITRLIRAAVGQENGSWHWLALQGGSLRNAIPRDAQAQMLVDPLLQPHWQSRLTAELAVVQAEFADSDPQLQVHWQWRDADTLLESDEALSSADSWQLLLAINACANGVERCYQAFEHVVETSSNLAILNLSAGQLSGQCLVRGAVEGAKQALAQRVAASFELIGAQVELAGSYPGWDPQLQSPLLQRFSQIHQQSQASTPDVTVIHAGLECGVLSQHYPHWQMVSFGPIIQGAHSPRERVHIDSVGRFWQLLQALLRSLAVEPLATVAV